MVLSSLPGYKWRSLIIVMMGFALLRAYCLDLGPGTQKPTLWVCVCGGVSYLPREAGILSPLGMAVEDFTLGGGFYQGWD